MKYSAHEVGFNPDHLRSNASYKILNFVDKFFLFIDLFF